MVDLSGLYQDNWEGADIVDIIQYIYKDNYLNSDAISTLNKLDITNKNIFTAIISNLLVEEPISKELLDIIDI